MSVKAVIIVTDRDEPFTAHFEDDAGRAIATIRVRRAGEQLVNLYDVEVETRQGLSPNHVDNLMAVTDHDLGREGAQITSLEHHE